jgi:3-hydroxybutyrate dehydrogenase
MPEPVRSILITGAGSGLGRGLSLQFARKGHHLLVTDLNFQGARETATTIENEGGRATAYALDVTSDGDIQPFLKSLGDSRVDVLINDAGLQHVASLEEFPPEKWGLLVDVMLKGTAMMTRAVLPRMRTNQFGRIINIGSIHSLVASPFKSAYVAAKHGLLGFSKVIALETGDVDITINTICPSYIRTPLVDAQIKAQAKAHGISEEEVIHKIMLEPMPKKAFVTVEEIAAAVDFLMSAAARNITGQTITIDGGWTCR